MHIIIADDNADFTDNSARYIARLFPRVSCHKAYDGAAAFREMRALYEKADGERIAALLDIRMPFIDGIALGRQAQRMFPDIRIIYISAYDELEYLHMAIRVGAKEYLTKPLDALTLKNLIERLILEESGGIGSDGGDAERRAPDDAPIRLVTDTREELCENFKKYIKENYSRNDLSLDSITAALYCSRSSLTMVVREKMHTTVMEYINNMRLKRAAEMLLDNRMYVSEVAKKTGFSGDNYFIRLFKSRYGLTPNSWRARQVGKRSADENP